MKLETEKEVALESVRQETEQVKIELERQKIALSEGKAARSGLFGDSSSESDLADLKLVPRFNERDPESLAEAHG